MLYYPLLLLLLVVSDNICTGFQPESRLPLRVGPKLRLALRQAKRSQEESFSTNLYNPGGPTLRLALRQAKRSQEESMPTKLYNPGKASKLRLALRQAKRSQESMPTKFNNPWKPTVRSYEADDMNEILVDPNELERVGEETEHLVEMIRTLEQAILAKQMVEPKLKRPKMDGRIRILKVCNLAHICYLKKAAT